MVQICCTILYLIKLLTIKIHKKYYLGNTPILSFLVNSATQNLKSIDLIN